MYLRSITLKGFKSFPERTHLEFGPGVSVIVGPNGSGKSNITDAVLWALGEQSPVAVRGQAMQDVIFSGAPGRQANRAAEVELVLDDSEGSLGLGAPEISIVRRLDRTGEGEYRLAGARCRLVDVIELLSDTGLGKEMHSVISQGRVESLVTSKPRDRRLLIEEAAGLGKHRKRRRRAQLKLERTQDNLDRALDVEREARTRLRPLKRQAEAAELHARIERQALEARWELARDELRSRLHISEQTQIAAAGARARREQVERELEAVARRREAAEEALAGRSAHRDELSRRCFVARSAAERIADRRAALRSTSAAVQTRLDRAQRQLAALEQTPEDETYEAAAGERIAELRGQLQELERERERELESALAGLEGERAAVTTRTSELRATAEAAKALRDSADSTLEKARAAVHQVQRAVEVARVEAARVGGELAAVNQFLRSHAGAPDGAPLLADQLAVDRGYELAVAAALDGRLRAVVVADRSAADSLLDRAGPDGGRALIAELTREARGEAGEPPAPGAELLAEHVQGGGHAAELARALLRHTWVVSSLSGLDPGFGGVAVTSEGRVLSIAGAELRQAPASGEERVLEQRNLRDHLIGESERAATAELAAVSSLEGARSGLLQAESGVQEAMDAYRAATRERDDAAEEERRLGALIERRRATPDEGPNEPRRRGLAAELRAEEDALARHRNEHDQRRRQIEALVGGVQAHLALIPELDALLGVLEAAGAAIELRRTWFEQELADDSEAGEHVAAELRECAKEEAPLQAQMHRMSEALTEHAVAHQRACDRVEEGQHELSRLAGRLGLEAVPAEDELEAEQRRALEVRLERLARRREQLGPVNPLAEEEYAEALAHVEELERQRTDLEDALRELEKLIADTDRQIRETFEQTFEATARNFEDVAAQLFPGGHGRLRLVADRDSPARVLGAESPEQPNDDGESDGGEELAAPPEEDILGVEIEINPAGKEMRRLSLLSGGEKSLTALAFLFAVFLARPCPFYILDEVEAALDDINIDRLLGLLRSYAQQAQFIVVTHQRRTMEAADFLYGVSMGGDGVSKVISRRLPRAEDGHAPATDGDAVADAAA